MSTGPGFGRLAALEMECLSPFDNLPREAKTGRCKLVEIPGAFRLLLGKNSTFTGRYPRSCPFGSPRERNLGLLGEGSKRHVGNEDRDVEMKGTIRSWYVP